MKNLLFILTIITLFNSCSKDNSKTTEEETWIISEFIYSLNEKDKFDSELALKIESKNGESIKTYKTKNPTTDRFDKIIFSDESNNEFIIESNTTADTLYIYQRDFNGNNIKEAIRYIKVSKTEDRLDFILINDDKSVTTLNQYTLIKKSKSGKLTALAKKTNTDIDDLESEINETGEFLADPTNTHPITAFYKGIVTSIFSNDSNVSNDVYDTPSKGILSTILDGLDSKRKNLLRNLGKINDFLKESKQSLKDFTQEQIDAIIKEIKEDELTDDEIDDDILKDCKGIIDGPAVVDVCGECVESILETCEKDCNGDFGGTAYLDNCKECVAGNTGIVACEPDCNGVYGGNAFLDNCGECVFGDTGKVECEQDCNGVFGGTAYLDNCNECVGGNTAKDECIQDCNGDFGGNAYLDDCNECVGGNTGKNECEFQLTGIWTLKWYTNDTQTELSQTDYIDFQNGTNDIALPLYTIYANGDREESIDSPATWNQSFNKNLSKLSLTNNYWTNITLRFTYDPKNPKNLLGESLGLSNNGFNLKLTKQ